MASMKKEFTQYILYKKDKEGWFIHSFQTHLLCAYFYSYTMLDGRNTKMHKVRLYGV